MHIIMQKPYCNNTHCTDKVYAILAIYSYYTTIVCIGDKTSVGWIIRIHSIATSLCLQQKTMSATALKLAYFNGIGFSNLELKWIEKLVDFSPSQDDLFVVTYPKSGTTWAQQIVSLIQRKGEDSASHVFLTVPWLEKIGKDALMV